MKKIYLVIFVIAVSLSTLNGENLSGDTKSWSKEDLIGFDRVADCNAPTGDISSVYARQTPEGFMLRITFDNMVTRKSNDVVNDNFPDRDISVSIRLRDKAGKYTDIEKAGSVQNLSGSEKGFDYIRNPSSNLLVILFREPILMPRQNMVFEIKIFVDNKLADEFISDGKEVLDGGNCAFVHHGNQGLTYTNVFYGNAFGISGLEGSGYDEVLQAHEATGTPGNFHMSGTLMPAAEWHNPEFNDWLATLASQGLVSMMTSALGQHIMPFVQNPMNEWSVYTESQMVNYRYNYMPHIAWIPERVWLSQGYYPDAGVIDWLGDNWTQNGVWGIVLDDWPHLNGYDNRKIHWMSNGSGVDLRVIPIHNTFVGNMHYNANAAKNLIASMGQYNICVYGTDWEAAAEMNEHDGTFMLDNYENVLWYCHDNYPGINVWKLEDAITNPDFNGTGANLTNGTYGLLGGTGGYGGSNNSWYINWASTPSHSDQHSPQWDYGTVWWDAYTFLMSVNDNSLAQLGWYTMMINLHETGWQTSGQIADWEHRYSSHIKNANVYTQASRWADGQYTVTTACYYDDIDHDGVDEVVMHNDKVFMVFESIGGKANWIFYKDTGGNAYSVVSSDMAYWSETEGDFNEGSANHYAALSDVWPNQQNSIYNITLNQNFGDTVMATFDQWGVQKQLILYTGADYLDVIYNFYNQTGSVKSGWSPDLLDILWSGKSHLQRIWGNYGSYCGYRNSASGATAALVLGNGGASQNAGFEGTLVKGDEIRGYNQFKVRLFAGNTSAPSGTTVPELNTLALENMDVFPPAVNSPSSLVANNAVMLVFTEAVDLTTAQTISNYSFQNFSNSYTPVSAVRQSDWRKVKLTIGGQFVVGDDGEIIISNVKDLNNNVIGDQNTTTVVIPTGITPHTIINDGVNDFISPSELIEVQTYSLYITWDATNLYLGFYSLNLGGGGDLFVNIDTDQTSGSGATTDSWGRVSYSGNYLPEYQVAIEGGGGSMQVNDWTGTAWHYPGNGTIGSSYEGWASNGLTEISLPWTALGNPDGIAISVHVTQENNHTVTKAFPGLNPTGNHPTLSYAYAFFEPYISGPMPLSGMEPRKVIKVPNTPPAITVFSPLNLNVSMETGTQQLFSVTASDAQYDAMYYSWKLDGLSAGSGTSYNYQPSPGDEGNHILEITVTDNVPGNNPDTVTWNIEVTEPMIRLSLKVFLEGPFGTTEMNSVLNAEGIIPLVQPYNVTPWNYPGTEEVISIPGNQVVDWILLELRDAPDVNSATSATIIARRAAFVKKDGTVISISGSAVLDFGNSIEEQLFVVVRHRDHLAIISANPLTQTEGVYNYDFTTSASQVLGGVLGYKELVPGIWGMAGGDANADGEIDATDQTGAWETEAGKFGYLSSDYSLDSQVNNSDKNEIWLPNSGMGTQVSGMLNQGFQSQVPE